MFRGLIRRSCYSSLGDNSDGNGSKTRRYAVDNRRVVDAQLMSAASSPGRTWRIFIVKRRVPVLAPASAAAFLSCGCRIARLSGMGGAPSSALFANVGNPNDSGD